MKDILKSLVICILHFLFIPQLILYFWSKEKGKIDEDVKVMAQHCDATYKGTMGVVYFLLKNKYYRNIFYTRIGKIAKICSWYLPGDKTFSICRNVSGGVYPAHPFATTIGAKSIGKYFSFRQCTTIGNIFDGEKGNFPIIEDDVYLGSHVCILGDIRIGRGSIIGAGSIVRKSLPPYSIVLGNPAKIVGFRFSPDEILEYEKKIYKEEERLPIDILVHNYKKYFLGKAKDIKGFDKLSL